MSDRSLHFEIVVVGAGPGGLAAACVVAEYDKRVAVVDDTPWLGGQIWRGQEAKPTQAMARQWFARFHQSGATMLSRTSIIASPRRGILLAEDAEGPKEIHWQQLIVATGARELFLPFPGWTLPGVVGPGGLQALVKNGYPVKGKRIVVAGSGPLLLAVADGLTQHGAEIVSIVEQASLRQVAGLGIRLVAHPTKLVQGAGLRLRLAGVPYRFGVWPLRAEGNDRVELVALTNGTRAWTEHCDLLACAFGLVPNLELPTLLGCDLQNGFVRVDPWQTSSVPGVFCVGEITGIGGAECALVEGQIAACAAAERQAEARGLFRERASWHGFRKALVGAFALRPELKSLAKDDTLLCRCEDVTIGRTRRFDGWRDAKLQTRCGMGACQGRICGAASRVVLGWDMESVRPPLFPVRVASLLAPELNPAADSKPNQQEKRT